jgi:hypothetical protein
MKKVEPGAFERQAIWKRRRDDLPRMHSTEKETDRYRGSTCNYRPSKSEEVWGDRFTQHLGLEASQRPAAQR